jgi:murein DD-endopeptidase MepM/ murein hydrolase activator NlpD
MQLIWISGSTDRVRKINITAKDIAKIIGVVCAVMIFLGVGIHFLGLRIAIEVKPDLARAMGGVITVAQLDSIETGYRQRLETLQSQLVSMTEKLNELKSLKDRFADIATPAPVKSKLQEQSGGKGGPFQPIQFKPAKPSSLADELEYTLNNAQVLNQSIQKMGVTWQNQYAWLNQLPIGSPIQDRLGLTSNYGPRIDPFTQTLAHHAGIDFSAPIGTAILASGNGKVSKVGRDPAYGIFVEIEHADGFTSKYAHARATFVKEGQSVVRGQKIAEVGSTGRSTSPHLHYEIARHGNTINPMQALVYTNRIASNK